MLENDIIEFIAKQVLGFKKQNDILTHFISGNNYTTSASFIAAFSIAKSGKPFTDGDFLKNTFISCSEWLFKDFSNKEQIIKRIKEMPLSARTVHRRIEDLAKNIDEQVKEDLLSSDIISIAIDESVDINNMGRLAIIIRFLSINNPKIKEELCILATMKDTTKGIDIFNQVKDFCNFKNGEMLDIKSKLFSITTDGAPSMRGKNIGFVKFMENDLGRPILSFHCIIHEENLFAKASTKHLKHAMDKVVKIVNFIYAQSSLVHRRFKAFLEEVDSKYGNLLLYSEVRWLSRGKVLNRFIECFEDIKTFLCEIGEKDLIPNNDKWFIRLLFLADVIKHYNDFNIRLQGNNHTILKMYQEWRSFISRLFLFENDVKSKSFYYFPY